MRSWFSIFVMTTIVGLSAAAARAQHAGDLWPAASAAGQLKLSDTGRSPAGFIDLPPASGLLQGWSSNDPGFDDITFAVPDDDSYPFTPGSQIRLRVVALDPALNVWTGGFQNIGAGATTLLGNTSGDVHTHLIWHIRSNTPDFNPLKTLWRGTFQLIDANGRYADSAAFVLKFRNVTCLPGDVNGDGLVNNFDIDAFVATLLDPASATAAQRCAADIDEDGLVTNFDIDAFVTLILSGGA